MMLETAQEARLEGVLFEGDRLPLVGLRVVEAKAILKDAGNISYFTDAFVSGRQVPLAHVLQPGDRLEFVQRLGCKAGDDNPSEQAIGEAVVIAYPELVEMAAKVKSLHLATDRSLDVMAGMVAEWANQRFGPPCKSVLAILAEVVDRLERIESPLVPLTERESDILEALGADHLTGEVLAKKAGYEYDGHLKGVLASLVKRRLIGNKRPGGYFLVGKRESRLGKD